MKREIAKRVAGIVTSAAMIVSMAPCIGGSGSAFAQASAPPVFQFAENGGGSDTDAYQHVAYTGDGGYIVAGYTMGDSTDPKWTYESAAAEPSGRHTNNDGVLVKYDKNNKIEWSMAYGGTGVEVFEALDITKDGHIAVAGREAFTSSDNKIKGVSWNVLLIDPKTRNIDTIYRIGGTGGDQAYGLAATDDGGLIIGGWSSSKEGFITTSTDGGETWSETKQLWQAAGGTDGTLVSRKASSGSDSIVVRLAKDGTPVFCQTHNYEITEDKYNISTPSERLDSLSIDENGDILISGFGSVARNVQNAVVAKLSGKDGSLIWHRSAGIADMKTVPTDSAGYMKAEFVDIAALTDGTYVAVGTATNDATTEEGWTCTAAKDTIAVHYAADGKVIRANSFGRASDSNSRPEGVTSAGDGGYYLYGSTNGVLYEDDLIKAGYNWGNYGAQDSIIVKYNSSDQVEWAENYGSTGGDWINGIAAGENGAFIAVGESNGSYGVPSYGNNGGIDGIVMVSDGSRTPSAADGIVADGDVVWKDGTYVGIGNGYGGEMKIQVKIADGKITAVDSVGDNETDEYYYDAAALYDTIVEQQTASVDAVSGATLSSNGIIEGSGKALSAAAAAHVDELIEEIEAAEDDAAGQAAVKAAADAYAQLGTFARAALENTDALRQAAADLGITLQEKSNTVVIREMQPELAGDLNHNDRYYKIQDVYYDKINADGLRDNGFTGKGVTIAVLDSGITGAHQDLDYSHILNGWDYGEGSAYVDAETTPGSELTAESLYDNAGHGTAVAGILQAVTDNGIGISGLLSEADIVPLRVIPSTKAASKQASSKQVAQAITDAVDKYHADVITTSLDVIDTEELQEAIAYANENNVIIVGASGNSSTAESTGNDPYIYPAAYDSVIGVGAVDKNNKVRTNSQKNDQVFVTAPGENVALLEVSKGSRCKISSGTSYSSPIVSAMAAAAKQRMIDLSGNAQDMTAEAFREALQATSMDAGEEGYDTSYGYGIVDLQAFAEYLLSSEELAKTAVDTVNGELEDLKDTLAKAEAAVAEAQAVIDALPEDATEEQITEARNTLTEAQNAVAELQSSIAEKEEMLNNALKTAFPSIGEEVSDLEQQLEDLGEQLAQAQIIDITNYSVTIGGRLEYTENYTGGEIRPQIAVAGVPAENYSVVYSNNVEVGEASVVISAVGEKYSGEITRTFKISKAPQPLTVKAVSKKVKAKKLRKKAQTVSGAVKITTAAQGPVTYKGTGTTAKAKKALKINKKTGKITVKKGTKKGTYKMKVTVKAAGNARYDSGSKAVKVTIKVK